MYCQIPVGINSWNSSLIENMAEKRQIAGSQHVEIHAHTHTTP